MVSFYFGWHLLKPGPAWQVDPRLEPNQVYKKIWVVKTGGLTGNPVDPVKPDQKLCCNSLTMFKFFIKTISFWFIKKIKVDSGNPMTWSILVTRALGWVDHQTRFKNTAYNGWQTSTFRAELESTWWSIHA